MRGMRLIPEGNGTRYELCGCIHPRGKIWSTLAGTVADEGKRLSLKLRQVVTRT